MPTLTFVGSEKLHGENMAVCYSQGEIWVQGRNHVRTLLGDQNGMAHFVESTESTWMQIFHLLEGRDYIDTNTHTIVLDCEWAGGNIQKGNAACSGTDKGAYLFDYYRVVSNVDDSEVLRPTEGIGYAPSGIYNMASFGSVTITLDFSNPDKCEEDLKKLASVYEDHSPIAAHFDKPDNVGEGAYLYCLATADHPTYRLKTKGEKHGGKPKVPREPKVKISDEELLRHTALAAQVTPVWRITQAITESNATEMKHLGQVIKGVIADVAKEETPTLLEAGIELKNLSRYISAEVKQYYFDSLKGF